MDFNVIYNIIAQDRFSASAKKIKAAADKIRSSMTKMRVGLDKTRVKFKKLQATIGKAGQSIRNFGLKVSLVATLPIALLGRSMLKAASDAEETFSKFSVVFRGVSKQADAVADNLVKNFGLAGSKAKELLSDTGDLLTGFGFTQKMALNLADEVNQLAVDLASFTNFAGGAEGASKALTKALLGERESVKSLGISILEEDVKKKVALLRSQGMTFATMRQAKAFATLKIAQEQSKNAIGDYNRTQDQFANKARLLSARVLDMKEKFGKIMIPLALKLTNILIRLMEALSSLSPAAKKIILVIAGIVAVVGPLLIIIGLVVQVIPLLIAGFTALGVVFGAISLPVLAIVAALTAAYFIGKKLIEIIMKFDFKGLIGSIGKFFGGGDINTTATSKSVLDVNVNAPAGAVKSVQGKTKGGKMNVGMNMAASA